MAQPNKSSEQPRTSPKPSLGDPLGFPSPKQHNPFIWTEDPQDLGGERSGEGSDEENFPNSNENFGALLAPLTTLQSCHGQKSVRIDVDWNTVKLIIRRRIGEYVEVFELPVQESSSVPGIPSPRDLGPQATDSQHSSTTAVDVQDLPDNTYQADDAGPLKIDLQSSPSPGELRSRHPARRDSSTTEGSSDGSGRSSKRCRSGDH